MAQGKLPKEHDFYPFINKLHTEERLNAVKMLKEDPSENSLVRRFVKDNARKVRDFVNRVTASFKKEKTTSRNPDSGTFTMDGPTGEATSEDASVTANGPGLPETTCRVTKTGSVVGEGASVPGPMGRIMKEGTSSPEISHVQPIGKVHVSSGKLVVCDPMYLDDAPVLSRSVPCGSHQVLLYLEEESELVAYGEMKISNDPVVSWHPADLAGTRRSSSNVSAFPVDTGMACFMDQESRSVFYAHEQEMEEAYEGFDYAVDYLGEQFHGRDNPADEGCVIQPYPDKAANMVLFTTGFGDGIYSCYCGHNAEGKLVSVVMDFDIIDD